MRLNTFGRAHVARTEGGEVALQPLSVAVLTYLAVGGPRDRDHLANLFWHNSKNGLNSLSTTLNRIRAEIPDGVWVQGNTLVGTELASDVGEVRDALDRSDFALVTQVYGAPFLGSLKLRRQSLEFEEWVLEQRTTLATTVELALLQHGRNLFDSGDHADAAVVVEDAWNIAIRDGFPSADYFDVYHRILATAASPSANAVRSMAEELGIELTPVEPIGFESNKDRPEATAASTTPIVGDDAVVANPGTPLFGCEKELGAIASSVATQALTTLVGLGGSGKTRLASEFFNSPTTERDFPHRYWVDLRDVTHHDLVAPAIATSLGQRFDSVASLADRLPDEGSVLFVLDNFEHVLASARVAEELTRASDVIRILVTSRVPLEVAAESLVQLSGLDTTDHGSDSPAEQLFVSSARRAGVSDDRLRSYDRAAIRDVCHRVGGNPLALEIAGGWAQILSPPEILDVLSVDNELLDAPMGGDLRSMDAVLKQSWSTLDEPEQQTLMLLATFPGGCLTSEALKLHQLSIKSVGRLVQHSLARLQVEGRITLHPLIAGHALTELAHRPELQREFQQVLSEWCQHYVATTLSDPSSLHSEVLDAEVANFAAAWSWDAQHRQWDLHRATLEPLRQFFNESGRVSEGQALFGTVANALKAEASPPQDLLSAVLEALGWFEVLSGELTHARTRLDEAFELSSDDEPQTRAQILRSLGILHLNTGEIAEATANFTAGLAIIGDEPTALAATLQHDLAQAYRYSGARDEAANAARLALQAGRAADNWMVMTTSYLLLADIEVESDPERAIVLLNEGWQIAKDSSLDNLAIYFPSVLGLAHLQLNDAAQAENYFTDGIDAANEVGQLGTMCGNYIGRAEARLLRNTTSGAMDDLKKAIRLALKTGSARYLMWAAVVSCQATCADQAPSPLAQELLLLTLRHPAADQDTRDKAIESLQGLFHTEPETDPRPVTDDEAVALDEIAERALQLLTLR